VSLKASKTFCQILQKQWSIETREGQENQSFYPILDWVFEYSWILVHPGTPDHHKHCKCVKSNLLPFQPWSKANLSTLLCDDLMLDILPLFDVKHKHSTFYFILSTPRFLFLWMTPSFLSINSWFGQVTQNAFVKWVLQVSSMRMHWGGLNEEGS
jgi:hypothetical protein